MRGRLAQLGEHGVRNAGVVGSNPMPSTNLREVTFCQFVSYYQSGRRILYLLDATEKRSLEWGYRLRKEAVC